MKLASRQFGDAKISKSNVLDTKLSADKSLWGALTNSVQSTNLDSEGNFLQSFCKKIPTDQMVGVFLPFGPVENYLRSLVGIFLRTM